MSKWELYVEIYSGFKKITGGKKPIKFWLFFYYPMFLLALIIFRRFFESFVKTRKLNVSFDYAMAPINYLILFAGIAALVTIIFYA